MKKQSVVCAVVTIILAVSGAAQGNGTANRSSDVVEYFGTVSRVLGYSDVDKLNLATLVNYYDDLNSNNSHDPGEPFAASSQEGWSNPKSAADNSCWFASACNMLGQLGKVADVEALYMDYACNGVSSPGGILTWDDGGLQEYIIQQWMNDNPAAASGMQLNTYWRSTSVAWTSGHYAWEDWDPRAGVESYLADGWEVGIGMWPLYGDGGHEGGHALTMQAINAGNTFDCTDSDRDDGGLDLNTYNDGTLGPDDYEGHTYYGWYNDFYSRDFDYWPDGDVGYVCVVVPEPGTLLLIAFGGIALVCRRKKHLAA